VFNIVVKIVLRLKIIPVIKKRVRSNESCEIRKMGKNIIKDSSVKEKKCKKLLGL
jgi:hypothetical protein